MERMCNRFGILALHTLVWTLPFGLYYAFERPSLSQRLYFQVAASAVALFYFGCCWLRGRLRLPRNPVLGAAVLFGLAATASSLGARSPGLVLKESAFLWSGIVVAAVAVHLRLDRRNCRGLFASLLAIGSLCAAYGVVQYFGVNIHWNGIGYSEDQIMKGRYFVLSLFGHPNYLTAFIGPALMVAPGLAASSPSRFAKAALAVAGAIVALCILVSGTRSAWLATLLVGGVLVLVAAKGALGIRLGRKSLAVGAAAVVVVALFVVPNPLVPHRYSFARRLLSARPVEGRLYFYTVATRMIAGHPLLGIGYNNFGVEFWDYSSDLQSRAGSDIFNYILEDMGGVRPEHAHNEYLQIAAETGVVGMAAFLLMVVAFFYVLREQYLRLPDGRDKLVIAGIGGAVAYLLIDCLSSFPLRLPASSMVFWLALGVGSRYGLEETEEEPRLTAADALSTGRAPQSQAGSHKRARSGRRKRKR